MRVLIFVALAACGGEVAVGAAGVPEESPHQPAAPTLTPRPETIACPSVGWAPETAAYVLAKGSEATVVRGDASTFVVEAGAAEVPADVDDVRIQAHARSGFVATTLSWVVLQNPITPGTVLSLFDGAGALLYRLVDATHEISVVDMGDDGSLALFRYGYGAAGSSWALVDPKGSVTLLDDFRPVELPSPQGWLRGYEGDSNQAPGWLHLSTETFQPVVPLGEVAFLGPHGDGFLGLEQGNTVPWLVHHRRDDDHITPLEGLDGPIASLHVVSAREDWLLVRHDDERLWRVEITDGAVIEVPPPPAPALDNYCDPPPMLTSDGDLVLGMAIENGAAIARFDPVSTTVTPIGHPLSAIESLAAHEANGTFVVSGLVGTFCPLIQWPAAPAEALSGTSTQVVRPESGANWVLPEGTQQAYLHPSGLCALYGGSDGMHLVDAVEGTDTAVGVGALTWAQSVWSR